MLVKVLIRKTKGGSGSGNWGHAGRPGAVGGSAPGGGRGSNSSQGMGVQDDFERKMVLHDASMGYNVASSGTAQMSYGVPYHKDSGPITVGHAAGLATDLKNAFREVLTASYNTGRNITISAKYLDSMYPKSTFAKYLRSKNRDAYYEIDPYAAQEELGAKKRY